MTQPELYHQDERATLIRGNNLDALRDMADCSVDSVVTDPPYGLGDEPDALAMLRDWLDSGHHEVKGKGFMGREWDAFVPQPALWCECLRVLKPGGHLLSFAGTRTIDLVGLGLRIAGFEIRDTIRYMGDLHYPAWLYGSGFPKNMDVAAAIDKHLKVERLVKGRRKHAPKFNARDQGYRAKDNGYNRRGDERQTYTATAATSPEAQQWDGWGTALKPAWEPIIVARKPLGGTVAATVLEYGTGAINIAGCRIATKEGDELTPRNNKPGQNGIFNASGGPVEPSDLGRWPANVIHDGSPAVLREFAAFGESVSGQPTNERGTGGIWSESSGKPAGPQHGDSGTAARFFYCAKASKSDRSEGLDGLDARQYSLTHGRQKPVETPYERNASATQNNHPTVKPTALMRYLVRLVTPPGGIVLDPCMGSGSTGKAAMLEGMRFIGIDLDMDGTYLPIATGRIIHAQRVLAKMPAGMKRRKAGAVPAGQTALALDA